MIRPGLPPLFRNRHTISLSAILVLTLAGLIIAYRLQYSPTLDLGSPGDSPFLQGFYADEPDIDYRYRWSTAHSEISLPGLGSAKPYKVKLRLQSLEIPYPGRPLTVTVAINGIRLPQDGGTGPGNEEADSVTTDIQTYTYMFEDAHYMNDISAPYVISIDTGTYRPPGDPRDLGLKVDYMTLGQFGQDWNWPSSYVALWVLLTVLAVYLLLASLPVTVTMLLTALAGVALDIASYVSPFYVAAYLPTVTIALAVLSALVWQRARILRVLDLLSTQAQTLAGRNAASKPDYARVSMVVALILFTALALWTIPRVVWIGHADYAENANVARSLVEGRGLTVDYVAQFYQDRPTITHPADTWPMLQPLMIAPFFALFGPQTWAAKLPNLLILLALAWGVFAVGSRVWDRRVGLLAGLFTLLHAYFFNSLLYPINDLAFTAIFFALAYLAFQAIYPEHLADEQPQSTSRSRPRFLPFLLIGALAALLIWSKPTGVVLLVGLALWAAWGWWANRKQAKDDHPWADRPRAIPLPGLLVAGGAFIIVLLPLLVRNMLAFGSPFYSTESFDAWILRYWPFYEWENIYKYYVGSELPHIRWVIGGKFGYANLFDAIGFHLRAVWDKGVMNPSGSEFVIGVWPLLGALVGLLTAPRRCVRLALLALSSITLYAVFVLLYWHFEGRYFQVAIPWLYLLLSGAVVWISGLAARAIRGIAGQVASTLLVAIMAAAILWPNVESISNELMYSTRRTSFTVAMDWLVANSSPDDIVMTRDPWELNWHSRRRAVMIPFDNLDTILKVAREYGVTMLQLGGPTDGIDVKTCPSSPNAAHFPTGSRAALGKLYCGYEIPGFTLLYKNGDLTIYRLSNE